MGITLIFLGLFLWFSLAFNGGVGEAFVNYSFFASALFMIIAGVLKIAKSETNIVGYLSSVALAAYIPMVWQRFNFTFDTDWVGFCFDISIVIFMLVVIANRPSKAIQHGR